MYIREKCYCSKCLKEIIPSSICCHCHFDIEAYHQPGFALPLDSILKNRYHIGCVIGTGGFGITYAGWDISLNKPVAIKEFFPRNNVDRDTANTFHVNPHDAPENKLIFFKGIKWFEKEARTLAALRDNPGIVQVQDYFRENDTAYIIMDFIHGKTLTEYAKSKGGILSSEEVLTLLRTPIKTLQKIHQFDILHRDISPDNLIVDEESNVYLIDFGAATSLDNESDLKSTELYVREAFSPPEQTSDINQGPWTDIYSICSTILYLIMGEEIPSSCIREQNDTLPSLLKSIKIKRNQKRALIHGLELKVKNRTENIAILMHELYNEPLPKTESEKENQRKKIRHLIAILAASYLLFFIVFATGFFEHIPDIRNVYKAWIEKDAISSFSIADGIASGIYKGGQADADYWFRLGADYGSDEIKYQIAEIYQEGSLGSYKYENFDTDYEYAYSLLIESSKNGYAMASNKLGWMYWTGNYVDKDLSMAVKYFNDAIEKNNSDAMVNLALLNIYEYQDYKKAFSLLSSASESGNYNAMYFLASYHEKWNEQIDITKALELMSKASEAGQPDAMATIGYNYLSNNLMLDSGIVWKDVGTGLLLISKAVGSPVADYYLGLIYQGMIDVSDSIYAESDYKINPNLSFHFMLRSAENGYTLAMKEVAEMYRTGYGTDKNISAAIQWENKFHDLYINQELP